MTIIKKYKFGRRKLTLESLPIKHSDMQGNGNILFFSIDSGQRITLCYNDPCKKELTESYVRAKGNKCPRCSKLNSTRYTSIGHFKKLVGSMLGNPSDFNIEKIVQEPYREIVKVK